ncbi:hypothetical protein [Halorussus aquaticus]|uniref:PH domain-containing protein n=1 Tax=Halorussus aquaticus TaxID=2953748 RepID=A0ABD5PYN3_9EURY|nr:hypothetical protein [Halorussus aquaticus]
MTDEWTFRTVTGTATATDGELRVSGSVRRLFVEKWRDGWKRNDTDHRLLFVLSVLGSGGFVARAITSARDVLTGNADVLSLLVLACAAFVVGVVAYRSVRTRTVSLRQVEAVRRVDDDELRVVCEGDRDDLEIETPTETEADEAVEILRLRGVSVGETADTDDDPGFRERLRAKIE